MIIILMTVLFVLSHFIACHIDYVLDGINQKKQYLKALKPIWKIVLSVYGVSAIVLCLLMGMWGVFIVYVLSMGAIMTLYTINQARLITHQRIQEGLQLYSSTKPRSKFELSQTLSQPFNNLVLETS